MTDAKRDIINKLQKEILLSEGFKPRTAETREIIGLKTIEAAFPNGVFPVGTIHEFLIAAPEQAAASGGFISGLLTALMKQGGVCLWISVSRTLFSPALKTFGIEPDQIIFVNPPREKDVLWVMEEALKYKGLTAVIAEVRELNFMQSRRLQLAVETSKVTGFVLRSDLRKLGATTCMARWQIRPIPSELGEGLPGVGFPRWQVELLKVRNGKPGSWKVEWSAGRFALIAENTIKVSLPKEIRKAG